MPFLTTSPRVNAMTSRTASLIARPSFSGGAFLLRARRRLITSLARLPALTIRSMASRASPRSGGSLLRLRTAAWAFVTAADTVQHDGGGELPHRRDAVDVREFRVRLAK